MILNVDETVLRLTKSWLAAHIFCVIAFLTAQNRANDIAALSPDDRKLKRYGKCLHFRKRRWWMWRSLPEWAASIPTATERKISYAIGKLQEAGLIEVMPLNNNTKLWYALSDTGLAIAYPKVMEERKERKKRREAERKLHAEIEEEMLNVAVGQMVQLQIIDCGEKTVSPGRLEACRKDKTITHKQYLIYLDLLGAFATMPEWTTI